MSSSKPSNKSYFVKRLRDNGYVVNDLHVNYSDADCRSWSVVIEPEVSSVIATCVEGRYNYWESKAADKINDVLRNSGCKENIQPDRKIEKYIELYDCGQFVPPNFKLSTKSMDVVVSTLMKFGIRPSREPSLVK